MPFLQNEPEWIDVSCEEQLSYWCSKFNCSEEELEYAVKAIGPDPKYVGRMVKVLQEEGVK